MKRPIQGVHKSPETPQCIFISDENVSSHFEKGVSGDNFNLATPIFGHIIGKLYLKEK